MNHNGFNLAVTTTMAAMLWTSALSALFFTPATPRHRPRGK